MPATEFSTTIVVDKTPGEVFKAVTNPRAWWSEEIEGGTANLNDEFDYHYKDVHICRMKLVEVVPNERVVWQVLSNYFNFTNDKHEWRGTRVVFNIARKGNTTELNFTHEGLVPEYECFEICRDAWTNYINNSLRSLIETGKGQPNPKEGATEKAAGHNFQTSFTANVTAMEAFNALNDVTRWWTENLEGNTKKPGDEFTVRFGDVHMSKQKLVEFEPGKKVVWLVTDSHLNFISNKQEWTNTRISFELIDLGNKFTRVEFTHIGLVPEEECFDACSNAWGQYIQGSLQNLIATGKGDPATRE